MSLKARLLSRRNFLMSGTAAIGAGAFFLYPDATLGSTGVAHNPLNIPALDTGSLQNGTRSFDLSVQTGQTEFFPGLKTPTLGINGSYLGPTLRMRSGENVRFNVANDLNEQTTLHWHGFELPATADGGPHQVIDPGTTWRPEFPIKQKASMFWYHSHLMGRTADQVWAGLAGMIIVDDESDELGLPDTYGVDDIPVVLQDRIFYRDGTMPYRLSMQGRMMGMIGNIALVNGTVAPYFEASTQLVRLRLLNGANASIYNLAFDDGRAFDLIGTDGGLLGAPVRTNSVRLAPGERVQIIVDMSKGGPAVLRNIPGGTGPSFNFLELRPAQNPASSQALPTKLADLPEISAASAVRTRNFLFEMAGMMGGFRINRKEMDINFINERVNVGETEIWKITNATMMMHPFHVHNTQFRILSRNGVPVRAGENGLKDTVLVSPRETVEILVRFDEYTDPDSPYMYHCHILEHEDDGMMGQFVVV